MLHETNSSTFRPKCVCVWELFELIQRMKLLYLNTTSNNHIIFCYAKEMKTKKERPKHEDNSHDYNKLIKIMKNCWNSGQMTMIL